MKHTKRFASLLLVLVMALSLMAVPAMAAGTGTITIKNAVPGETYKIYKIFDLESYSGDAYAYKIDKDKSPWMAFLTDGGAGASYVTIDLNGYVTWNTEKDNDESYAAFAAAALLYAEQNHIPATGTETASGSVKTSVTFENLDLGYYVVNSSLGNLAILDTTDSSFSKDEKNELPSVEKSVEEDSDNQLGDSNTADIGQEVTFQTTITVKGGATNYVLHDTMTGLTFQNVTSVQKREATGYDETSGAYTYGETSTSVDSNLYTVTKNATDGCSFDVSFEQSFLNTLYTGDQIVVTYTATVNENAVVSGTGNPNKTHLVYGNNNSTVEDETKTYTWDVDIFKYTEKDSGKVELSGAEFVLYKTVTENETEKNLYATVFSSKLTGWAEASIETDGSIKYPAGSVLTSGSDGKIKVEGLDSDTYYLREIKAPAGYNELSEDIAFVIDGTGNTKVGSAVVNDVEVENNTGSQLPTTGGMGTTVFYVLGGALMLGAVVLLITKKRMGQAEK